MNLQGKKVVVIGLGKSGMAAYELLEHAGADVCLYDGKKDLDISGYDAPVYLETIPQEVLEELDCAVFSPGVPLSIPVAEELRSHGVKIIGEIELASFFEKGMVIGITGTNGKTTTTTLVGEIMKAHNEKTYVVGNIGYPYTKEVLKTDKSSVTVAEISSFQLETTETFAPKITAILNITPDHLNRHKTMDCYADTKFFITKNQGQDGVCVLNYEDEIIRKRAENVLCPVAFFSSKRKIEQGLYQNEKHDIVDAKKGKILMNMSECRLPGDHNCENIMAAILMTQAAGVPMDTILDVVRHFHAVEHRVEYVTTHEGVEYYNDSKGTNPDAAIKGIESMSRPTILIGGGYDKGGEFDEWIQAFHGRVKKLLLMGETTERIIKACKRCGFEDYECVNSLEEAVQKSYAYAKEGDAVLLSPACASWDMFESYEQRGDLFKELVGKL